MLEKVYGIFPRLKEREKQAGRDDVAAASSRCARSRAASCPSRASSCSTSRRSASRRILVADIFRVIQEVHAPGVTVLLIEQNVFRTLAVGGPRLRPRERAHRPHGHGQGPPERRARQEGVPGRLTAARRRRAHTGEAVGAWWNTLTSSCTARESAIAPKGRGRCSSCSTGSPGVGVLGRPDPAPQRAPHGPRAGPSRPRRIGEARGRLFARRLRQRPPRSPRSTRPRPRDPRRALSRGRHRLAVRLPVPRACERLVLVSSGGLGREVHPALRAAALPGAEVVLPWLSIAGAPERRPCRSRAREPGAEGQRRPRGVLAELRSLEKADARRAFLHTVRGIIDLDGQRVSAQDRLYLAAGMPTLIVWGERDRLIPVRHARAGPRADRGKPARDLPRRRALPVARRARRVSPTFSSTS